MTGLKPEYNSDDEVIGDNYNPLYENPLLVTTSRHNLLQSQPSTQLSSNNILQNNQRSSQLSLLPSQYNHYAQIQYQQQQQLQYQQQQKQLQYQQQQKQLQYQKQQSYQQVLFQQQPQQISVISMFSSHNSTDSLSDILPIGWARLQDTHGDYYINILTQQTQRIKPTTDANTTLKMRTSDATIDSVSTVSTNTTYSAYNNNKNINNPNRNSSHMINGNPYVSPIAHNTTIELNVNESYSILSEDIPDIPKSTGVVSNASSSCSSSEDENQNELRIDKNQSVSVIAKVLLVNDKNKMHTSNKNVNEDEWCNAVILDENVIVNSDVESPPPHSPNINSNSKNSDLAALSNIFVENEIRKDVVSEKYLQGKNTAVELLEQKTLEPAPMIDKQNSNLIFRHLASVGNEAMIHSHLMFEQSWDILVDSMQQNIQLINQLPAFNAMKKIATNLLKGDAKYRVLYNDNDFLQQRILEHMGGYEYLLGLGFKENDTISGQLVCGEPDVDVIKTALRALNKRIYLLDGCSHEFDGSGKNIDLEHKPIRFEAIFNQLKEENENRNVFSDELDGDVDEAREKAELEIAIKLSNKQNMKDLIEQQERALANANKNRDSKIREQSSTPLYGDQIGSENMINFTSSEDEGSEDNVNDDEGAG